jgi:hypothetical protein
MSTENAVYALQFEKNVLALAQQEGSKLFNAVTVKNGVKAKAFNQPQIGAWTLQAKAGRNSDTPIMDSQLANRYIKMKDYNGAVLLDRSDELKAIAELRGAYQMRAVSAIGNTWDDVIISALGGTAESGEGGTTSNALPSTQKIAVGSANLTFAKVLATKKILDNNDVPESDRFFLISPAMLSSLLNTTQATSSDYNTVRALTMGEIDTWLGFKFIRSTRLALSGNNRTGYAFHKTGLVLGVADGMYVKTDQRADKSYSWQVYFETSVGAGRLEEKKVVEVVADESK